MKNTCSHPRITFHIKCLFKKKNRQKLPQNYTSIIQWKMNMYKRCYHGNEQMSCYTFSYISHHRTHGPKTYVRGPWLIVLVIRGYSFNVHA